MCNIINITINKITGEVVVDGDDPCQLCAKGITCDKVGLKDCWVPCG